MSYCKCGQTLKQVTQRGFRVCILGEIQKPIRYGPEQPSLGDLALYRGLDWVTSRDPLYSVIPTYPVSL